MNVERLLAEIAALPSAMLWSGPDCLNTGTCSDVDIVRFVMHATTHCRRIRAHMHQDQEVTACEAETGLERITWLPAHRVTPGAQRAVPHPFYAIADDLLRLSGNRTYTFLIEGGLGAALNVHDGKISMTLSDARGLYYKQGGLAEEEAYELIGAAGYYSGKLRVHLFNAQPPHRFYAASSVDGTGLRWLPEEYAFEEKHLAIQTLRERFNFPEEDVEELGELFEPSYYPFDFPMKDKTCQKQ